MLAIFKYGAIGKSKIYLGHGTEKYIKVLIPKITIDDLQKFKLIALITESYYNTNNDTDTFASEYFYVVDMLLNKGYIPLELKYLAIEELHDEIIDILKEK